MYYLKNSGGDSPLPARPRPQAQGVPFVDRLAAFGARPAVLTAHEKISYLRLAERVEARAGELGHGRRLVAISGGNTVETLVTYLAALKAGHVVWLLPDVACRGAADLLTAFDPDVVASPTNDGVTIEVRADAPRHGLHPELALVMGTSGSTGAARLVRLSHANIQSNAEAIARSLEITSSECAATTLPLHYCYGLSVVNSHLCRGAALLLTDLSVTDEEFWSLFRRGEATSFAGVPHTFDLLDRIGFEDFDLPHLRYITQAGGRLAPSAVRRFADLGARRGWAFVVMYGQTEATARMAYLPPQLAAAHPGTVGVPIPGGSFEIAAMPDAESPDVGEIIYRGPNVMLGYAEAPADLALGRVVHELRTGDLGRRTEDGLYEIVGRRSRFLKLFGMRIDLQDVERLLEGEGHAATCAGSDKRLVVAVTDGRPISGIEALLAKRLGLPRGSILAIRLDHVPLLPSGKPDYQEIVRRAEHDAEMRRTPTGRPATEVAALFCDIFDRESVDGTDTFSSLGGDSLSYVEMSLALEEVLGHLPDGWPDMPVAGLADLKRPRGRTTQIETNVALRAGAITLVVLSHMTAFWPAGGAHLLFSIAGYNFARFQLARPSDRRWFAKSFASIARIAAPASTWISLQTILVGGYSVGAILLVNNYTGAPGRADGRWHYWFFEALVQTLIVLTLFMSVPPVRRLERRHPFAFVLGLLTIALAVRFDLIMPGGDENAIFRPHEVVWLFLIGWATHRATTASRRLAVSAIVLACVPGFFGQTAREIIIICGLALLLWLPMVAVPRPLHRICGAVAAGSMYIYLTHWQIWPPLTALLPVEAAAPVTIAGGVVIGLAVDRISMVARRRWRLWMGARRGRLPEGRRGTGAASRPGAPWSPTPCTDPVRLAAWTATGPQVGVDPVQLTPRYLRATARARGGAGAPNPIDPPVRGSA